jgi:predicted DNA binding protein
VVQLSNIIGSMALVLAGVLATAYAFGEEDKTPVVQETVQKKVEAREAQRRAAMAEHKKRKEEFARRCTKSGLTDAELEACRVAYRRL